MELQCDKCFVQFDLNQHRPKSLPCGHTLCKECVRTPAFATKCPTCSMHLAADTDELPDNLLVVRMIEDGLPARGDDPQVQQLRSDVDAGRKLVQQLRRMVPLAVAALTQLLDSAVANLRQTEEALGKLQRQGATDGSPTPEQVQLAVQLRDSLQLLSTNKYSVTAEQGGDTWRASGVELSPSDHVSRLLLLQLRASEQLQKDDVYIGPPGLSTLSIVDDDLKGEKLKVDDILRDGPRWKNIRTLKNLTGSHTEKLLRVLAPQLEELEISDGEALPSQMEEVKKMTSLKRLLVDCDINCSDYPELPLQLEELSICFPSAKQLRCVQHMPRLRSLNIEFYPADAHPVLFRPPLAGRLLWLGLMLNVEQKDMMFSLISASAATLRELHINTYTQEDGDFDHYFPELGPDLGACGLLALRRLVLRRPFTSNPCDDIDACLQQRQTLRDFLPSAEVVCYSCQKSYVLG
ncbi:uncharacterized protein LOC113217104 [Frankliniella occidentalis]|uniref:Uncharacterized protein LOC113217104 n=1 Tax=Frankliniella occidentalis TaxID=133901 RepID=A0A6J1TPP7_FRAOC|nr:uncharacterized protein LOC113217104 [Frankliniella occidentalis]